MAKTPTNMAASVKDRLLKMARLESRVFETVLVRFALERFLYRLSLSSVRDRFVLKGGLLVTTWIDHDFRTTRDADFLGYGTPDTNELLATTFTRRATSIPATAPTGLSEVMVQDLAKQRQWKAYAASIGEEGLDFTVVIDAIWESVGPSCVRLNAT